MLEKIISVLTSIKNSGLSVTEQKKTELIIIGLLVFDIVFK